MGCISSKSEIAAASKSKLALEMPIIKKLNEIYLRLPKGDKEEDISFNDSKLLCLPKMKNEISF